MATAPDHGGIGFDIARQLLGHSRGILETDWHANGLSARIVLPVRDGARMTTVLVLEDGAFIGLDLQYAFEDVGATAVLVSNSDDAFDALQADAFDGAVLDVNLGHGQTCEKVAVSLTERDIPSILNTGDLDRAGEFLRGLGAPVVAKPTVAARVVERLQELIAGRRATCLA